jgi:phosphate uptake regulator
MPEPQLRKIQLTGGTTYTISLPKEWANQVGIKPQQQVALVPQDDLSLLLIPKDVIDKGGIKEASIDYPSKVERDVAVRDFISYYLAGYDLIRVRFRENTPELKAFLKDSLRKKLVGIEIIEESLDEITAQCLPAYAELPLKRVVSRMSTIVSSMHKDAILALKNRNNALAKDVIDRDDEVDRFYHFAVKQLKMAVVDRTMIESIGLKSAVECLGYRIVTKSIERIADHVAKVANSVLSLEEEPSANSLGQILRLSDLATDVFDHSLKALNKLDAKMAHESIIKAYQAVKIEEEISKLLLESNQSTKTIVGLKLILESLKRIAVYSAEISEIALNIIVATLARERTT